MELTKKDTKMAQGIAVLGMVMLHLFCRLGDLPYTPWIWVGATPLVYYLGLFGDLCVPVFCFCSGYAHYLMADAQGSRYRKRLPGKALRFLSNYWIVVVLFSLLGLVFDRSGQIPGSWKDFVGNMLVVGMNYNGAWWFVSTYLILLVLSPAFAALTKRLNGFLLLAGSLVVYFAAYVLRFNVPVSLPNPVLQWVWDQAVLLGTSQLGYFAGMILRKYGLIGKVREQMMAYPVLRRMVVFGLPTAAFLGHCVVQTAFVAPFTAVAVLIGLFLAKLPLWAEKCFLLLGKHSTNIWLVHMFFYLNLFKDFVFFAKYPILVLALMLVVCFAASLVIDRIYQPVLAHLDQRSHTNGG
jgi:hypothetical protein